MTDSAPKKTDWRVVALLFVVGIFAAWQFAKIALPLLDLAQFYQRDPKSLAFLVSVVGLVGATFGVVAGNVVAGIGAKRALVFGLMGGAVVSGAQALLPSLPINPKTRARFAPIPATTFPATTPKVAPTRPTTETRNANDFGSR